jgi:tetratricopeptide (TPR) repeat protein
LLRGFAIVFGLVALFAVTVELYLRSRTRSHWHRMEMLAEQQLLAGGLQGLLRSRTMALSGAAAAADAEVAATLALASAMLASDYGLDETQAARSAADAIEAMPRASQRAQSLKLASRALVEMTTGHPDRAEALARESVFLGHKQASPLFALGRVRLRQGDLGAAAHAFQAALVREPGFIEARVAWAEVWFERGEPVRARDGLLAAAQHTPDHSRMRLLLAELDEGQPGSTPPDWETTCARDESISPFIAGACDLARALQADRNHDRKAAIRLADSAGRHRPAEPRTLGRAAQLLASMGTVDRASTCLDEALRIASPTLPSVRWAKLAVELGRGYLPDLPQDLPATSSPWAPLLKARIALASGGIKALTAILPELQNGNAELDAFVQAAKSVANEALIDPDVLDPIKAYVYGMQARLAGKAARAADLLSKALQGHGDACRAAGEYLAVCRELGRMPNANAFAWLVSENGRCVNLPANSDFDVASWTRSQKNKRH